MVTAGVLGLGATSVSCLNGNANLCLVQLSNQKASETLSENGACSNMSIIHLSAIYDIASKILSTCMYAHDNMDPHSNTDMLRLAGTSSSIS